MSGRHLMINKTAYYDAIYNTIEYTIVLYTNFLKIPKLLKPIFLTSPGRFSILLQIYIIFDIIWVMGHPGRGRVTKHLIIPIIFEFIFNIFQDIKARLPNQLKRNRKINNYL